MLEDLQGLLIDKMADNEGMEKSGLARVVFFSVSPPMLLKISPPLSVRFFIY